MKTRIVVKTPLNVPVWQQSPDPAQRLLQQVKKLTRELHKLQNELYRELAEEDGSRRKKSLLIAPPAADDLIALKDAADHLRRVLWFYLDASPAAGGTHPLELRPNDLETQSDGSEPQARPLEPGSFFERLNLVIDGYMQNRVIPGKTNKS